MESRTRVLYIAHGHPDFAAGGGELAGYCMYRSLQNSERFEPFLLAAVRSQGSPLRAGTRLLQHEKDSHTQFHVHDDVGYDDFFHLGADLSDLAGYLAAVQPEVVHLHHFLHFGIDLFWLLRRILPRARIVLTLHEFLAICAHNGSMIKTGSGQLCYQATTLDCARCFPQRPIQDVALRARSFREHLGLVDYFIASTEFQKRRFIDWGIPAELIEVLENGRPLWELPPRSEDRGGEPFTATFLGQIVFHKGADVFLEAAAHYLRRCKHQPETTPEVRFEMHGAMQVIPDALAERIETLLRRCAKVVRYHGRYSREQVPAILSAAHCVVVPSKWWENSPLVIQEAFMARRPVLCSDVGGMAERVLDGVNGMHFRMGDPSDLLQKILALAGSPEQYRQLVAGISPVYSEEAMSKRLHVLYDELLAGRRPSRHPLPIAHVA